MTRFALLLLLLLPSVALAQHNHARHHNAYVDWINQEGRNCCHNQDCGELPDADERTSSGKLEVRVEGQWCEILPHHYLKRGNVPNAASSHVCVQQNTGGKTVCERLLCFQPRPGT